MQSLCNLSSTRPPDPGPLLLYPLLSSVCLTFPATRLCARKLLIVNYLLLHHVQVLFLHYKYSQLYLSSPDHPCTRKLLIVSVWESNNPSHGGTECGNPLSSTKWSGTYSVSRFSLPRILFFTLKDPVRSSVVNSDVNFCLNLLCISIVLHLLQRERIGTTNCSIWQIHLEAATPYNTHHCIP